MSKENKMFNGPAGQVARSVISAVAPSVIRSVISSLSAPKSSARSQRLTRQSFAAAGISPPSMRSSRSNSKKKNRRRNRRGPPGPRNMIRNYSAPVNTGDVICITEESFKCVSVRDRDYGPGICCAFASQLGPISTVGTALHSSYLLPLNTSNFWLSYGPVGFIDPTNANTSGLALHPANCGPRVDNESIDWSLYRFKWIKFWYQNTVATSTPGALMMGIVRDPCAFVEAAGTPSSPTISISTLSQVVPVCQGNLYHDIEVGLYQFSRTVYPTETPPTSNTWTQASDLGTTASARTLFPGRLAALFAGITSGTAQTYGNLWVTGEIEFYQPVYNTMLTSYRTNPNGPGFLSVLTDKKRDREAKLSWGITLPKDDSKDDEKGPTLVRDSPFIDSAFDRDDLSLPLSRPVLRRSPMEVTKTR